MSRSAPLDPRVHAYRSDLADISLADSVKAKTYIEPAMRQCVKGLMTLYAEPSLKSQQVSQIRYGEFVDVFETRGDGFVWVQNRSDRYVGYLADGGSLRDQIADLSNRVSVLKTYLYPKADIKTIPIDELTLGSYVKPCSRVGDFMELASGGFVFAKHVLSAEESKTPDYVFTAGRLLGVPYLWGGRTSLGLDCSALVQLSLEIAGFDVPRDSDQQCALLGAPLSCHWRDFSWKRGDIVFFKEKHVGIMTGPETMIHASGYHMLVIVEPLTEELVDRRGGVVAVGKLSGLL